MNDILLHVDETICYGADGRVIRSPRKRVVLVMNIPNPAKPKKRASLKLMHSLPGPPAGVDAGG